MSTTSFFRNCYVRCLIFLFIASAIPSGSFSWGFWAHKEINRLAVFAVHPAIFGFFKQHIHFVTEHAADPDMRRYAVEGEAECHFMDLDRYGTHPFDSVPARWKDAVALFGEDSLRAHGILPWNIQWVAYRLTEAFRKRDLAGILKNAADIGHYIGDAHVPLHCTRNYNGQLTGQHGIHGLWESRIPELLGSDWDHLGGMCRYIDDPLQEAWKILRVSYAAHDSVLDFERQLTEAFPSHRKFAFEMKNGTTVKTYSREFTAAFDQRMAGMVERRMNEAIASVASFWYTCWVNAGQPDLQAGFDMQSADSVEVSVAAEQLQWNSGKLDVRKHDEP